MKSSRSEPLLPRRTFTEKCKIEKCPRNKRLGSCGLSNFCKVHEVFIFLIKLKYSLKKLFGNLSSGFAVLQRESGDHFSLKDLCNFMNFLMIPYLIDDVQNVFEILGKKHGKKNTTVIKIEDMKKTMKSKEYNEIIDVEIRIILEVIMSAIKTNGIKNIISALDSDKDGIFNMNDFIKTFRIREAQAYLFFMHVFKGQSASLSKFVSLFPNNSNELYLELSEINAENGLTHFFAEKKPQKNFLNSQEKFEVKKSNNLLEDLRVKLREKFETFEDAFCYIANSNNEIGFFQVQKILRECDLTCDEKTCRTVISSLSQNSTIQMQNFKEFWLMRGNLCSYYSCLRPSLQNEYFCDGHITINKKKAVILLEKIKSQTSVWRSPRKIIRFYRDLEVASSKNDLFSLKGQLNQILPLVELPNHNVMSLHSILGKMN